MVHKLHFHVLKGHDLRNADFVGKSDSYAVISLRNEDGTEVKQHKTDVKKNNLNPHWDEKFEFEITDTNDQYIRVEVFDKDKIGKDDNLGFVEFRFGILRKDKEIEQKLPLLQESGAWQGSVSIKAKGDWDGKKKKIAVLGGGAASMAAVFEIVERTPNWQDIFEITVYQIGWRLGGKGASGRNREFHDRNEEHGLHILQVLNLDKLLPFAAQTDFDRLTHGMLNTVYEVANKQKLGDNFPDVKHAIHQTDDWQLQEYFEKENYWVQWPLHFPKNPNLYPGNRDSSSPDFVLRTYILLGVDEIKQHLKNMLGAQHGKTESLSEFKAEIEKAQQDYTKKCVKKSPPKKKKVLKFVSKQAKGDKDKGLRVGARLLKSFTHNLLDKILDEIAKVTLLPIINFLDAVTDLLLPHFMEYQDNAEVRRAFYLIDTMAATLRGLINNYDEFSKPHMEGWLALDDRDFLTWMVEKNGLNPITRKHNPVLINMYRTYVYFIEKMKRTLGHDNIEFAAGSFFYTYCRAIFTTTGCPQYMMNGGMGDTIFAPIYKVLKFQGVKFEFFHRAEKIHLNDAKNSVESIDMIQQVQIEGEYDPLYPVQGKLAQPIDCWPSLPMWERGIVYEVNGKDLRKLDIDHGLESYEEIEGQVLHKLKRGKDFDLIVNGISVGAYPYILPELIEANKKFRDFVEHGVKNSVHTLGMQLWFKPYNKFNKPKPNMGYGSPVIKGFEKGWKDGDVPQALSGSYIEPWNGYTDTTDALAAETWDENDPEAAHSQNSWWGIQPMIPEKYRDPAHKDDENWPVPIEGIVHSAQDFIQDNMAHFWPDGYDIDGNFEWDKVVVKNPNSKNEGRDLLFDQWFAHIMNPSESYNRCPPGSTKFRIHAGDFVNYGIVFTGDHIITRFNVGLVEGAVESGIRAANAVLGEPEETRTVG